MFAEKMVLWDKLVRYYWKLWTKSLLDLGRTPMLLPSMLVLHKASIYSAPWRANIADLSHGAVDLMCFWRQIYQLRDDELL